MSFNTSKYIYSSQRRGGHGGLLIVIPNQARGGGVIQHCLRPLGALLGRAVTTGHPG